jgi:hypothetical protein
LVVFRLIGPALRLLVVGKPNAALAGVPIPVPGWVARLRIVRHLYRLIGWVGARAHARAVSLFFLVSAALLMQELGSLLRAMHPVGGGAYGVGDLSRVLRGRPPPHDVYRTWHAWDIEAKLQHHPAPGGIVSWWLGIDTLVLVPAYTVLFAALLIHAYAHLSKTLPERGQTLVDEIRNGAVYRRLVVTAFCLLPFLWLLDWSENAMLLSLANDKGGRALAVVVRGITGLKELLFLIVLMTLGAVAIALGWQTRRGRGLGVVDHPDWLDELRLVRVQAVIVGGFGFLLLGPGPLGDQSRDVVRRMGDHLLASLLAFALILAFAAVIAASSRLLLDAARTDPVEPAGSWWQRFWPSVAAASAGFGALVVLGILAALHVGPPVGLFVPAGVALLVGLLDLAVGEVDRLEPEPPPQPTFVWRTLASAPLALFGVLVLEATTGDVFYSGGARPIALLLIGLAFLVGSGLVYVALGGLERRARAEPGREPAADELSATEESPATAEPAATDGQTAAETPQTTLDLAPQWRIFLRLLLGIGVVIALVMFVGTVVAEHQTARVAGGTMGVIAGFMIMAAVVAFVLAWIAENTPVPPVFAVARFRRIPVIGLFILWFVIASVIDKTGYHVIRTFTSGATVSSSSTLGEAFDSWVKAPVTTVRAKKGRAIRPLVLVAATGGGIRAAYWTTLVLDCLVNDPQRCGQDKATRVAEGSMFAFSGVSGGALGLVEYAAHESLTQGAAAQASPRGPDWVNKDLGGDYLGATFAHMLFVDVPNAFLRARYWHDRAATLEGEWERSWGPDSPLKQGLYQRGATFPLLLLNGTSVTDGCRFETSVLRLAIAAQNNEFVGGCRSLAVFESKLPNVQEAEKKLFPTWPPTYVPPTARTNWVLAATRQVQDYLCDGRDISLSTAALLAARFPIVSPTGRVTCDGRSSYVVDGGYFEDSGVGTIDELWSSLEPLVAAENAKTTGPCIVPFLIEIDNHYSTPAGPGPDARPDELLAPLQTIGAVRGAHDADARLTGALRFSGPVAPNQTVSNGHAMLDRVAYVYPLAHPGSEAPLGWTLSEVAKTDLNNELENPYVQLQLERIRQWFKPRTLSCTIAKG